MSYLRLVYLVRIEWDVDEEKDLQALPEEIVFTFDSKDYKTDQKAVDAAIEDATDRYGFVITDCDHKVFSED